ncbi:MAG: hypothetical protein R3C01_09070 [Planctomycetaceae bacterium]
MMKEILSRDEYVEQAYFFSTFRERLAEGVPSQEILKGLEAELLATTRLPIAVGFLAGEIEANGRMSDGMQRLSHYFTPFQTFLILNAELDATKFDVSIALLILEREAAYRSEGLTTPGLFIYQFECLARNRLGYDKGITAMAGDPQYDAEWKGWFSILRRQLGSVDFADLIYLRSELAVEEARRTTGDPSWTPERPPLFGRQEGRIARAHRGRDSLHMFAALQRHLGYPAVPRPKVQRERSVFDAPVEFRFQKIETRLNLVEAELKGGIDLSQFYARPDGTKPDAK